MTDYIVEKFDRGMHFVRLDEVAVQPLLQNGTNRVLCTLNDTLTFHGALLRRQEGYYFVQISRAACKKLGLKVGSRVRVLLATDTSDYQFEMPDELREVLATDPEADQKFHALTKGNQRGLIYLVLRVKSSDQRIEKALKIAQCVKLGINSPQKIAKFR